MNMFFIKSVRYVVCLIALCAVLMVGGALNWHSDVGEFFVCAAYVVSLPVQAYCGLLAAVFGWRFLLSRIAEVSAAIRKPKL